jgi:hypothetical protein
MSIARMLKMTKNWERIQEELDKCALLCEIAIGYDMQQKSRRHPNLSLFLSRPNRRSDGMAPMPVLHSRRVILPRR